MSNAHAEDGPDKDELAAAAIAAGRTWAEAAEAAGMSLSTVTRRMATREFRARVGRIRDRMVDQTVAVLVHAMVDAARFLQKTVNDADARYDMRLKAAEKLLDIGMRYREQIELAERVRRIEESHESPSASGEAGEGGGDPE